MGHGEGDRQAGGKAAVDVLDVRDVRRRGLVEQAVRTMAPT
jgi:hypothetical protein